MSKKMKSIILSLTLFVTVLFTSVSNAEFLTLNQIGEASCRVRVSSSAGSGTSIAEDEDSIYYKGGKAYLRTVDGDDTKLHKFE